MLRLQPAMLACKLGMQPDYPSSARGAHLETAPPSVAQLPLKTEAQLNVQANEPGSLPGTVQSGARGNVGVVLLKLV